MTQRNNVQVTLFDTGAVVLVEELSEQQQKQLGQLLEASGVHYQWHSWLVTKPGLGAWFNQWWRRLNAWIAPLILLALLSTPALAQDGLKTKPRAVAPVRVSIESEAQADTDDNREFHRLFRAELNKRADVALKSRDFDYAIFLAATRLQEKGRVIGAAAAFLVIARDGGRETMKFDIATAPTLGALAQHLAAKLGELFKQGEK